MPSVMHDGSAGKEKMKTQASQHLIKREFEKSAEVCQNALQDLKSKSTLHNSESGCSEGAEEEASQTFTKESNDSADFMLLIMQAFAELERWQEVLPYVTNFYNGIENCPSCVLKICLLLHAKVKEYSTCAAIYMIWMRSNEQSCSTQELLELIDVYVRQVLIPTQKISEITLFIANTKLDEATQKEILEQYAIVINEVTSRLEEQSSESTTTEESLSNPQGYLDNVVAKGIRTLKVFIQWCRTFNIKQHSTFLLMIAITLLAVLTGALGKLDLTNTSVIVGITNMLKFLFRKITLK